jgi:hypothetical protein
MEAPMASIARKARQRKITTRRQHKKTRRQERQGKGQNKRRRVRPPALPEKILRIAGQLLGTLAAVFTRPTWERFVILLFAAILTTGCRTILNLLRTVDLLSYGHATSYHRVFSQRRWSLWQLGRAWAGFVLQHWVPTGVVVLAGDDTVTEHRGKNVYGKGRHRDAVRSSHSYTAHRYGHKWVVLAVLVRFPWASRPWALPMLCTLYRSEEWNRKYGRRHKTPPELLRQMLAVLRHWFPERRFVCVGDGNFGTHALAAFAHRHRQRLALVSRFYPDANLYAPPPENKGRGKKPVGRPRGKGKKQATPEQVVADTPRKQKLTVAWYGGQRRDIAVVTGTGHWYKSGQGLVPVRWVYVHDRTGTHRDEYFFTTDLGLTPKEIVELYTARWNLETTFQELRSYLKLEKTRGWSEKTVLRTAPCLFGLYGVIAVLYAELPSQWQCQRAVTHPDKTVVTFSDAITAVRRWLWAEWVFANPAHKGAFAKIPHRLRVGLLNGLAPAA